MCQRKKKTKIYRTNSLYVYKTINETFAIEGNISGKRIRERAKLLSEAKSRCHIIEEGARENVVRTTLTKTQILEFEQVYSKIPHNVKLADLLSYYLNNYNEPKESISNLLEEYLETKKELRAQTYKDAKSKLRRFSLWIEENKLESVDVLAAEAFLRTVPAGSYNHFLRHCKGLYNWANKKGYTKDNPFACISSRKREHREVSMLSYEESKALLMAAESLYNGGLLAYVAITLFAGLRPDSEMKYLSWKDINLADAEIRVTKGKTRIPRTVDIPENLVKWLRKCDTSRPIYPKNFRRKWAKVRNKAGFKGGAAKTPQEKAQEAGLKPWVKDYTRHTAISYRVRQTGDIHRIATWAGNSPAIIRSHYLGLVSGSDAFKYIDM